MPGFDTKAGLHGALVSALDVWTVGSKTPRPGITEDTGVQCHFGALRHTRRLPTSSFSKSKFLLFVEGRRYQPTIPLPCGHRLLENALQLRDLHEQSPVLFRLFLSGRG
jgi:hypothetical protein